MADPRLRRIGREPINGAAIRAAREGMGWSRAQLAAAVGLQTERSIYRFEDEDHPPSPAVAAQLLQVLGMTEGELYGRQTSGAA